MPLKGLIVCVVLFFLCVFQSSARIELKENDVPILNNIIATLNLKEKIELRKLNVSESAQRKWMKTNTKFSLQEDIFCV